MVEDAPDIIDEPKLPAKAFVVGALTQFALGLHAPFLQTYLVDMQNYLYGVKNFAELGAFSSVGNVAPTVLQPVWGGVSDKVGHRKPFVAFGTMMGLVLVYLFLWAATPIDMIILYAIQSVLFSIQIPTWLSLIGGLMGEKNRGDELGKLGLVTNIASLLATLASGLLAGMPGILPLLRSSLGDIGLVIFPTVEFWREAFYLPFFLTAIFGISSSVLSITIKEKSRTDNSPRKFPPMHKLLSQPSEFRKFSFIAVFFSFAMSMAWPLFIVVQRDWLSASIFEIALASALMPASTIIFSVPFGRLSDRVGRKPLILLGRMSLFIVPIMYAFAWNMWIIYLANFLAGFTMAASINAITAYIYDITPEEERGAHLAVYNTFTGIVYTFGSFMSGIFGQLILIAYGSEYLSVFIMLLVSGILRFIAAFFYLLIEEPKEYSSTLRIEFHALFHRRRLMMLVSSETDNLKDKQVNPDSEYLRGLRPLQKGPSLEDTWRIEIRRGLLQYAVLAIVNRHGKGIHGYGIAKELEERTDGLLQVKEGTLYPILHRLKKERLLNVHDEKSESGPSRKVYVLTGEGDRVYRSLTVLVGNIFEKLEALNSE